MMETIGIIQEKENFVHLLLYRESMIQTANIQKVIYFDNS